MKVVFLYHVDNEDLYALFIEQEENGMVQGYSHIGQHSLVHTDYIKESRLATKCEYLDLLHELENVIGYEDLEVRNEINVFEL